MADQIYFVENAETKRIKVGFTDGPVAKRLRALQTGSDAPLRLLGIVPAFEHLGTTEMQLHRKLRRFHHRGEWFNKEALTMIREILEKNY
jgi:hypothetical protein